MPRPITNRSEALDVLMGLLPRIPHTCYTMSIRGRAERFEISLQGDPDPGWDRLRRHLGFAHIPTATWTDDRSAYIEYQGTWQRVGITIIVATHKIERVEEEDTDVEFGVFVLE